MSNLLLALVGCSVSLLFFDILFFTLNQSKLRLFVLLQMKILELKNPEILKLILNTIVMMKTYYWFFSLNFNSLFFGIILGFFFSLINIMFSESITM